MARLQKKKPVGEKQKKKAVPEEKTAKADRALDLKSAKAAGVGKTKSDKSIPEAKTGEQNLLRKAIVFLKEVKMELKKVTWPTRKQTTGTTVVVIIFVFIIAAFLGLFDFGLSKLVQVVLT